MVKWHSTVLAICCVLASCSSALSQSPRASKLLEKSLQSAEQNFHDLAFVCSQQSFDSGHDAAVDPVLSYYITVDSNSHIGRSNFVFMISKLVGGTETGRPEDITDYRVVHHKHAEFDDRIFSVHSTDSSRPFRDVTKVLNDETLGYLRKELQRQIKNPLALTFTGVDGIYFGGSNFPYVRERLSKYTFVYGDKNDRLSVWEAKNYVWEVELGDFQPAMPVRVSFYIRPEDSSPLKKGDKLGELVYRTTTEWKEFEVPAQAGKKAVSKRLPTYVLLEQVPYKQRPEKKYRSVELQVAWKLLSDRSIINEENILQRSERDPIGKLFLDLELELDRAKVERDLALQRRKK